MRKISGEVMSRCGIAGSATQSQRHVAGPTADIQDLGIRPLQNMAESSRRAPPPPTVDIGGENMIEQVVARRDLIKHLLHRLRSGFFIPRAVRFGASG